MKKTLIVAICLTIGFQAVYGILDRAPDFDESIYLILARSIHEHHIPLIQSDPPVLFLRHPPLHYYFLALSTGLLGDTLAGARIGVSVLSILLLLVFYRLGAVMAPPARGLALLILAVNPAFLFYAHSAYMEMSVTLLTTIVLCALMRNRSKGDYAGAGVALGLALVTKYYAVTLCAGIVIFWLHAYKRKFLSGGRWIVPAIALCVFGAWVGWGCMIDRDAFFSQTRFWLAGPVSSDVPTWRTAGNFRFALELLGVMTPLVTIAGIFGLLRACKRIARKGVDQEDVLAYFLICHIIFLAVISIKDIKYCVPILPLICAYAARELVPILSGKRWATALAVIALIATSTPAAYFPNPLTRSLHPNLYVFGLLRDKEYRNYKKAGEYIRATKEPGTRLCSSERAAIIGYYARTSHKDLWGPEWEATAQDIENAGYVVLNSHSPYLTGQRRARVEDMVRQRFEPLVRFPGRSVDLTLWGRPGMKGATEDDLPPGEDNL